MVDSAFVSRACKRRVPNGDEAALALAGLRELGILADISGLLRLKADAMKATEGYRRGIRDAFAHTVDNAHTGTSVCVALPPDLPTSVRERLLLEAVDLRASLIDVIASSTTRLVLASPFWDMATAVQLGELAGRRVAAGVKLDILGRSSGAGDPIAYLLGLFAREPGVRVFRWYERRVDGSPSLTFHFKAVIADDGEKSYVGTANLTRSGLASTMELGFIIGARHGHPIARIVDSVIALSEHIGPNRATSGPHPVSHE